MAGSGKCYGVVHVNLSSDADGMILYTGMGKVLALFVMDRQQCNN